MSGSLLLPDSPHIIVFDGGAGTGTSSLARETSHRLSWNLLNTGDLYRTVALLARQQDIMPEDVVNLEGLVQNLQVTYDNGRVVTANGQSMSSDQLASMSDYVARYAEVGVIRPHIRRQQHAFAQLGNCVAEGRDLGTVVFPGAILKLFLVCDDEVRAHRRSQQLGRTVTVEELLERDRIDAEREESPMRKADGGHVIDTSDTSVRELASAIEILYKGRLAEIKLAQAA